MVNSKRGKQEDKPSHSSKLKMMRIFKEAMKELIKAQNLQVLEIMHRRKEKSKTLEIIRIRMIKQETRLLNLSSLKSNV